MNFDENSARPMVFKRIIRDPSYCEKQKKTSVFNSVSQIQPGSAKQLQSALIQSNLLRSSRHEKKFIALFVRRLDMILDLIWRFLIEYTHVKNMVPTTIDSNCWQCL